MAIGAIWQPPIDRQTYDSISARVMVPAQEAGCRFHAAGEGEGGWRIIEVWESREGLQRFIDESLIPVIDDVSGGRAEHPMPEVFEIHAQES